MRHAGLSQSTGGHARARLRSHDRLFFRHSAGSARDTRRARQACQAGPARLPGLAKPARATPPGRPQHGTALLEFTLAAAVLLPAALLAAEAATWQTVRQTVQLALMEAAARARCRMPHRRE